MLLLVTRACCAGGPAAGDRRLANLLLGDVAAVTGLGRAPVLCALADAQRLLAAAAVGMKAAQQAEPSLWGTTAREQRAAAQPQRRVRRSAPSGTASSQANGVAHGHDAIRPATASSKGVRSGSGAAGGSGAAVGSGVAREQRRQLRLAGLQLSGFLLPWANEQPPSVFADVAQAVVDAFEQWR